MSIRMTADMFDSQVWRAVEEQFDEIELDLILKIKEEGGLSSSAEHLKYLESIRNHFRMQAVDAGVSID